MVRWERVIISQLRRIEAGFRQHLVRSWVTVTLCHGYNLTTAHTLVNGHYEWIWVVSSHLIKMVIATGPTITHIPMPMSSVPSISSLVLQHSTTQKTVSFSHQMSPLVDTRAWHHFMLWYCYWNRQFPPMQRLNCFACVKERAQLNQHVFPTDENTERKSQSQGLFTRRVHWSNSWVLLSFMT